MWKKLNANHSSYFLNFKKEDDIFKIYATDYLNIWFANFSETSFVDCLKESNPDLELNNDILRDKGILMLSNPNGLKKVEIKIEESIMFFQKVTQPLLKMIQSLQSSDNELQLLLKKKDREIEEYKSEGIKVARHFKTPKFDEKAHKSKYNVFEENFGASEIPNGLLKKSVSLPEEENMKKHATIQVKLEPKEMTTNIKIEPQTPTMESLSSSTITTTASVKRELVKTEPGMGNTRKKRIAKLNL